MEYLERIRKLAETTVNEIIQEAGKENIRNGLDPEPFITDSHVDKFVRLAQQAWDASVVITVERLNMSTVPFTYFAPDAQSSIQRASQLYKDTIRRIFYRTV